ncbi:MAG: NfeD family protein [Woeseiaceae bacterium]
MRVMIRNLQKLRCLLGVALAAILLTSSPLALSDGTVIEMDLEGALGVATAEYIIGGIDHANDIDANAIIIRMDTPGGLMEPMRDIIQAILASEVPVVTYVSPGGARADSAGTFIVFASHVAAMAPTTHLGAASPVSITGGDPGGGDNQPATEDVADDDSAEDESADDDSASDDTEAAEDDDAPVADTAMGRKVMNDAIAYIRGLAETQGRNADWAEDAVRNAATLTAPEALEKNVVDLIAADRDELLSAINGREVMLNNEPHTVDTDGVVIEKFEKGWRLKVLDVIASPEIALLLVMIGIYGLWFEGYSPGAIVPGVVGVISLLLAAYALQVLPVNYAGLILIVIGVILIIAEALAPSFGALGLGGLAALIFGSIMMFDSGIPGFGISISFVVGMAVVFGAFLLWLATYLVRLQRRGAVSGTERILHTLGVATESFTGEGHVWLEGESWVARSSSPVARDQEVRVRNIDGLVLEVEPIEPGADNVPADKE